MKVKLCVVGALILLSSITSIFNNLVVVDTSAQLYDEDAVDALVEKYEKQGDYYADKYNGHVNSDPSSSSSTYEQGSNEYSSYDNYEPSDYGNSYDSSYSNDGYGAKNSYNYDDKYSKYPPKDNDKDKDPIVIVKKKLFVCNGERFTDDFGTFFACLTEGTIFGSNPAGPHSREGPGNTPTYVPCNGVLCPTIDESDFSVQIFKDVATVNYLTPQGKYNKP